MLSPQHAYTITITLALIIPSTSCAPPCAALTFRASLEWRASTEPESITWDDVASEGASGKMYVPGRDKRGGAVQPYRKRATPPPPPQTLHPRQPNCETVMRNALLSLVLWLGQVVLYTSLAQRTCRLSCTHRMVMLQ